MVAPKPKTTRGWHRPHKSRPSRRWLREQISADIAPGQARRSQARDAHMGKNFVSTYASSHPWEDFAETWTHYMHIIDTLETARAFGLKVQARPAGAPNWSLRWTSIPTTPVASNS